jgi:hypothetical protein
MLTEVQHASFVVVMSIEIITEFDAGFALVMPQRNIDFTFFEIMFEPEHLITECARNHKRSPEET